MEIIKTRHYLYNADAREMGNLADESVDLVVTSPPYPMIEMWDDLFSTLDPDTGNSLENGDGESAFDLMHSQLNRVWTRVSSVLKKGGIACINIGDATRKIGGEFKLYPSHSVISDFFRRNGFGELPSVIWKKPSNSPSKFLGSGTMPVRAYVTLEHEYILIFRKEGRRDFSSEAMKQLRRESSFFWEERNTWFSDVWDDLKGIRQSMANGGIRDRSAAFPFLLPYRLINMYSVKRDVVLDPFAGTGTTALAAIASERNSCGYETDNGITGAARKRIMDSVSFIGSVTAARLSGHREYVSSEEARGKTFSHWNPHHKFRVKTASEEEMRIRSLSDIRPTEETPVLEASYEE